MCGRWAQTRGADYIIKHFNLDPQSAVIGKKYNISPGNQATVISQKNPKSSMIMTFGLIPSWAKNKNIGYNLINIRAETILEKETFANLMGYNRVIVPATGFYEWQNKQPYYFTAVDHEIFAFAGLYSTWENEGGQLLNTFAIITTEANETVSAIHDRMPVILSNNSIHKWLDRSVNRNVAKDLLFTGDIELNYYEVSDFVNNSKNEGAKCIARKQKQKSSLDTFF